MVHHVIKRFMDFLNLKVCSMDAQNDLRAFEPAHEIMYLSHRRTAKALKYGSKRRV